MYEMPDNFLIMAVQRARILVAREKSHEVFCSSHYVDEIGGKAVLWIFEKNVSRKERQFFQPCFSSPADVHFFHDLVEGNTANVKGNPVNPVAFMPSYNLDGIISHASIVPHCGLVRQCRAAEFDTLAVESYY